MIGCCKEDVKKMDVKVFRIIYDTKQWLFTETLR